MGARARPDDQNLGHVFLLKAAHVLPLDQNITPRADKKTGKRPKDHEPEPRVGILPVKERRGHKDHGRVSHRLDHDKDLFDPPDMPGGIVEPPLAEQPEEQRNHDKEHVQVGLDTGDPPVGRKDPGKTHKIRDQKTQRDHGRVQDHDSRDPSMRMNGFHRKIQRSPARSVTV
ncbi:MAG: hypothetical protein BWY42_01526 [Candidatus Omnitrophica bacterium ADurb.Bin277]|nr:MAG: hypothetical protein BWY42_01526 [Candidatus Omnitrophica bacterium ADurb.Bin277]